MFQGAKFNHVFIFWWFIIFYSLHIRYAHLLTYSLTNSLTYSIAYSLLLGALSRLYIVRMLRGKGIYNQSEYITFLQLMEAVASITSKDESQDHQKISSAELKEALAYAKNKKVDKVKEKQGDNKYFGETRRKSVSSTLSAGSRRTVMLFNAAVPQVETRSLNNSLIHPLIHFVYSALYLRTLYSRNPNGTSTS